VRVTPILRDKFNGAIIVNGGYDAHSGHAAIARGEAVLVAFGVPFLANPDLPARYRYNASLAARARQITPELAAPQLSRPQAHQTTWSCLLPSLTHPPTPGSADKRAS
jgi:2,4-dienoyl-CoA reductase-like NADH-dependent reductase (Old Yellow Enzyme family)